MKYHKTGAEYSGSDKCEFTLWAPSASAVEIVIQHPVTLAIGMERENDGYWRKSVAGIKPGYRYMYRVDSNVERPDPSSSFQPLGVHGPSEVVDHKQFAWGDREWKSPPLGKMIFYELHTGTFTTEGTFESIIPLLPELKELGITTIELMPVAQFPGERNWGYDGVYPYAVQNSYGGPEGLKKLCDACHAKGLSLFLDVVYNHLGPEGNYLSVFGPYFNNKYKTPWGDAVNFDGAYCDGVRSYFIMNAIHWFANYHIDGLRVDAVHGIFDQSPRNILEELADAVREFSDTSGKEFYLIAESDLNDSRIVKEKSRGGYAVHAQWNDDFHHSIHTLLTGDKNGYYEDFGDIAQLAKAFSEGYVYTGEYSKFRKRSHGISSADIPGRSMVVFVQNHDQAGNRMLGERLITLAGYEAQKLAAGTLMVSPYIPLLFMGEEYGEGAPFLYFVSHGDPDLIEAVRNGRRNEFSSFGWSGEPPDPQAVSTFNASKTDRRSICMAEHSALYSYYKELISLRKKLPALRNLYRKNLATEITADGNILVVRRKHGRSEISVLMNYSGNENLCITGSRSKQYLKIIDSADKNWNGPGVSAPSMINKKTEIRLKPYNFLIYSVTERR
ncbi:MAG TPA: malto-oligosyltrehalose trehalohydrolase [Spirochaetota bacterium]|nr:malto-oligosyltrehalose trehalohydrolase [Spirochaetota bacterium]